MIGPKNHAFVTIPKMRALLLSISTIIYIQLQRKSFSLCSWEMHHKQSLATAPEHAEVDG